jgi:hypothetical protein
MLDTEVTEIVRSSQPQATERWTEQTFVHFLGRSNWAETMFSGFFAKKKDQPECPLVSYTCEEGRAIAVFAEG